MSSHSVHSFYKHIHTSWDNGTSMSDMYHLILEWMQDYRPQDIYPDLHSLVKQWLGGAITGEDTHSLVESFLFAEFYRPIHAVFEHFLEDQFEKSIKVPKSES